MKLGGRTILFVFVINYILQNSVIDERLGIFTAVRGCNSNQAAKLNQVNIVKYTIECLVSGTPTKQLENKSYFGFSSIDFKLPSRSITHEP